MRTAPRVLVAAAAASLAAACAAEPAAPIAKRTGAGRPTADAPPATEEEIAAEVAPVAATHDVVHYVDPEAEGGRASADEAQLAGYAAAIGGAPTLVYVNGDGRTVTPSNREDSAGGLSTILPASYGARAFPAAQAKGDGSTWAEMLALVREDMAPYNIQVTDQRPAAGAYIEILVTAAGPSAVGLGQGVGGVAPMAYCGAVQAAIGYVFEGSFLRAASPAVELGRVVAHEAGHSLGLAHTPTQGETMSYNFPSTRAFAFLDAPATCGTSSQSGDRCACGEATQNNHRTLLRFHGASAGTPPPPSGGGGGDTAAPKVALLAPAADATFAEGSAVTVEARATDDVAVTDVRLYWAFNQQLVGCQADHALFPCTQTGDRVAWTVRPGIGPREFYVVATDAAGNRAQSETRRITMGDGSSTPPPPAADAKPTIANVLPIQNQVLTPGGELTFQARATDDKGIRRVAVVWIFPSTDGARTAEYDLPEIAPGVFSVTTSLAATAVAGERQVIFRAEDTAGQRTELGAFSVWVQ